MASVAEKLSAPVKPPRRSKSPVERVGVEPGKVLVPGSQHTRRGPGVAFAPLPNERMPGDKRKLAVDWSLISTAYIDGKVIDDKVNGGFRKVYPTYSELEARFGVRRSTIAYRCIQEKWGERRVQINQQVLQELEIELSKRRAIEISDVIATLDDFLGRFALDVKVKKTGATNIGEYERALKLRVFALNEMRSREAGAGVITLEQLQHRHSKQRELAQQVDPAVAGQTPGRDEREAAGELEQEAQALADQKVAVAEGKAQAQGVRAEGHLASLGRARQELRDRAANGRLLRYREKQSRLSKLDPWAKALLLLSFAKLKGQ